MYMRWVEKPGQRTCIRNPKTLRLERTLMNKSNFGILHKIKPRSAEFGLCVQVYLQLWVWGIAPRENVWSEKTRGGYVGPGSPGSWEAGRWRAPHPMTAAGEGQWRGSKRAKKYEVMRAWEGRKFRKEKRLCWMLKRVLRRSEPGNVH